MAKTEEPLSPLYRPVKPIPYELVQHCSIFLEEKLYTQALNLLLNILSPGAVSSTPIYVPSPQLLAVAATFLVHPSTTTRARTAEEEEAPNAALRLLRLTNTLVGPTSAKLTVAFSFTHFESSRQGRRRHVEAEGSAHGEVSPDDTKPLNIDLGQSASVWSRAEDFWHVVGWAFNCSILHPERWARWQIWLEFMCEVLEDDWNERERQSASAADDMECRRILQGSLISRYIVDGSAGHGRNRRILRAIFADGGSAAVNEFREVFHKELKQLKRETNDNVKKREVEVNIDEGQYGDYLSKGEDESDATDSPVTATATAKRPTRQSKRTRRANTRSTNAKDTATLAPDTAMTDSPSAVQAHVGVSLLGGLQSLALRQRLLHLLSAVAKASPDAFTTLDELYHLFVENIRHLPLPIFQAFVSPFVLPHFSAAAQTTLCEFLLFRMRETAAPETDEEYLDQTKLETCFLPYAASTPSIVDNAKISITLEALLLLLAESDMLTVTPALKEAVQLGIMARAEKAQIETRKNHSSRKMEDVEWCWLLESGERLMFLVDELLVHKSGEAGVAAD
ncbi:uncharacterized protein ACLA_052270 [Aspergillus clavatus NRRL 1]|uniref:Uncharacterized protein n=1 Tax=Aspergillus clavatus (strain ATCC 1007 / CBS 513.65 / DSM 816 / NCTC 3887 / NRRL 1 / QM 1276 / 107) TaxID=344612 RepID=A1CIP9_ASPCL|nr:uncharacterized protein ACLA_052270 [Aspergillus clavatus NRRL 1]EAW10754.1 conserved hypothetical protein [Aspergillus clavatus NRRL 1]